MMMCLDMNIAMRFHLAGDSDPRPPAGNVSPRPSNAGIGVQGLDGKGVGKSSKRFLLFGIPSVLRRIRHGTVLEGMQSTPRGPSLA